MTYKNAVVITGTFVAFLLTAMMATTAFAEPCDLTGLDCWGPHKKCNIKFKNLTGLDHGAGGGTGYEQVTYAATIKISARKADGSRAGKNSLSILAGADNTLNLDKKENFADIRIERKTGYGFKTARLRCNDVKSTLNGDGLCKVFVGQATGRTFTIVTCDGGNVLVDTN